jgi:hypothetical protein
LVAAVGGPTPAVGQGILSHSDYMDSSGFDVGAPALGKRYLGLFGLAGHLDFHEKVSNGEALHPSLEG